MQKKLDLNPSFLTKRCEEREKIIGGEEGSWLAFKRKTRYNSIDEETKKVVHKYWVDKASRPTKNKRHLVRKRVGPKEYVSHMKHILEKSQTEIYFDFKKENPNLQLSQRAFEQLRSYFVAPCKTNDRRACLCRYHVEIHLLFNAAMNFRKSLIHEFGNEIIKMFHSVTELVDESLCPKDEDSKYHKLECINEAV